MPIFEFECVKKGHRFEKIQKADDPNPPCVKCKGETEKVLSIPAARNPDYGIQR